MYITWACLRDVPDPTYWSPENVRQWILWQCNRYNLTEPNVDYLYYLTGLQLCQLSEDDFKMCAPASGTNLYWRLFNWKTGKEISSANHNRFGPTKKNDLGVPNAIGKLRN